MMNLDKDTGEEAAKVALAIQASGREDVHLAFQSLLLKLRESQQMVNDHESGVANLHRVLAAANERADKAESDAAAMREAIERACTDPGGVKGPDEWSHDIDMLRAARSGDAGRALLAEVARLREENAALRAANTIESCMHGQERKAHAATKAALGRAHAALKGARGVITQMATAAGVGFPCAVIDDMDAVLADSEGRAAEYVAALEAEHEPAGLLLAYIVVNKTPDVGSDFDLLCKQLNTAHAAVEALRDK